MAKALSVRWIRRSPIRMKGRKFLVGAVRDRRTNRIHYFNTHAITERGADEYISAWILEKEKAENTQGANRTFAETAKAWLESRDVRPITLEQYKIDVERVYVPFFGKLTLAEIDREQIERFLSKLKERGLKASTRNKHLTQLRAIFAWAVRSGDLERNAAAGVKVGRSERHAAVALTVDQARGLLAACAGARVLKLEDAQRKWSQRQTPPPYLQLCVLLGLTTGLRRRNLFHLRWGQVDMSRRCITIDADQMKSHVELSIPVSKELAEVLEARLKALGRVPAQEELVLGTQEPLQTMAGAFKTALRRAGLPSCVRLHDLRHTFSSWLASQVPFAVLRQLLGHSAGSGGVTSLYTHVPHEQLLEAVDQLPRLLVPPEKVETKTGAKRSKAKA